MQLVKRFFRNCLQVRVLAILLTTVLWSVSTLYLPQTILSGVFSLLFLPIVPGYVFYRTIVGYPPGQPKSRTFISAVGLSLVLLMVIGLGVNQTLPLLGQSLPLTVPNLVFAIGGFTAFFTVLTAFRRHEQNLKAWRRFLQAETWRKGRHALAKQLALSAFLLFLPPLAIGGATMLNNGGSPVLALTAVGLVALVALGLIWTNKPALQALYPLGLFSIAATLLLGTSMRGWEITGHDVMQEFQVFQLTTQHSLWSMSFYQDAYTACLSITILPTILQKLSGLYDPYIFKLVFQLIFALMGPLLYTMLRGYVPRKSAFLAAIVFMSFPAFLTDMMMLNRQEVAMMLFALGIATALDASLSKPKRHFLIIIFLGGMVLSHYSTSYVTATILVATTMVGVGLWIIRPLLRKMKLRNLAAGPNFSIFPPYIVALVLLMIVGWSGYATHTAGNISQTLVGIGNSVVRLVHPASAPTQTPVERAASGDSFSDYVSSAESGRSLPASEYYSDAYIADFVPAELEQPDAPVTPLVQRLGISGALLDKFYSMARTGYVALLTALLGLGLLVMLLKRTATKLPKQYALLGVGGLVVVVMQVVLPSDAINYGLARVIQQELVVLALPAIVAATWLLSKLRVRFNMRYRLLAVGLVGMFLILSSWLPTLTGGFKPALAFSNSGFYYEAYYTHPSEIEADQWLASQAPGGSRVFADEFSRRKMITYANIFAQPTLIPTAIPVDSYVYLSSSNTTFKDVAVYYNGNLLFYSVPEGFLNTHKNLFYNSGQVKIYR